MKRPLPLIVQNKTVRGPIVARAWPGSTVVCIGGGPSLTKQDVDHCRGKAKTIAINDAYRLAPWAEVLFAADTRWWRWHNGVPGFEGVKMTTHEVDRDFRDVHCLRMGHVHGLSKNPGILNAGGNSGYQAINLAYLLGAARILLLGYDMQLTDGKTHWFGDHPNKTSPQFHVCLEAFPTLAKALAREGVAVVNCTRRTALTAFPRQELEQALP